MLTRVGLLLSALSATVRVQGEEPQQQRVETADTPSTSGTAAHSESPAAAPAAPIGPTPSAVQSPASAPVPATRSWEVERDERAAELFRDAEARYAAGDVAGALERMQSAYDLSGRPELLFNLGQLHRELGHCVDARNHYDEYLARVTDGRRRDEATRVSAELQQKCPKPSLTPPSTAPAAPAAPAKQYWTPLKIAGWASIGAGVAAAVGATYFAVQASHDENTLDTRLRTTSVYTASDKQLENDGHRAAAWAQALTAGAIGLVGVGVSLLVLHPGSTAKETTALSLGFDAHAASAVYHAVF